MIKILFVFAGELKKGGTENVMMNIISNINHEKFTVDLLLLSNKGKGTEDYNVIERYGGKIYSVIGRKESYFRNLRQLEDFFSQHQYDIVHTHCDAVPDTLRFAKKYGIKVRIVHSHNTMNKTTYKGIKGIAHSLFMNMERYRVRRLGSHFVACSEDAGRWMFGNRIINSSKFIKFNNGIDVEKYRYNIDTRRIKRLEFDIDGKYVLGNVGRLSYQKNQAYLLDIFESIRYKNSNTVLFIVGEGELENELKEKAKLKKIENYVYFLGSRDDINDLMQIFDVFVFPSHFEGLGIALVEAQASGLKCFASTNVPKESNILGNIEYLDCNLSPDIWADKINTYLLSKIEFDRESAADCVIKNGYDIKSNIRVIENFYMKCLVDVGVSKD